MQINRNTVAVQIRRLIERDMPEVLAIEHESFNYPWPREEFLSSRQQRDRVHMVAERDGLIVGFMIYEHLEARFRLMSCAVGIRHRRTRVGRQMIRRLVNELSRQRLREIMLEVRETNLAAQLFFKAMGFLALGILPNRYQDYDCSEDAYLMRYLLAERRT